MLLQDTLPYPGMLQIQTLATEQGIGFVGLGFDPKWSITDIPIMPKGRYALMRSYMPRVGTRGHDMMFRTCTIQVCTPLQRHAASDGVIALWPVPCGGDWSWRVTQGPRMIVE